MSKDDLKILLKKCIENIDILSPEEIDLLGYSITNIVKKDRMIYNSFTLSSDRCKYCGK